MKWVNQSKVYYLTILFFHWHNDTEMHWNGPKLPKLLSLTSFPLLDELISIIHNQIEIIVEKKSFYEIH